MSDTPLVSVVIPTYNSEEFIDECILSVINQSYTNIEIIVVDDGSKDKTLDKLSNYINRIYIEERNNSGRGAARRIGEELSKGKYISYLDHDDILLKDSVKERVELLENNPDIGWVFTDAIEFDKTGDLGLFLNQFPWLDLDEDTFVQLLTGCFPLTSTVMIKKELVNYSGGFNPNLNRGEDIEYFMRLLLISKVGLLKKPLTRRRIHPNQGVSSTFDRWNCRVNVYSQFKPSKGRMSDYQKDALAKALMHAYFKLGECYWEINQMNLARKCFSVSFGNKSWMITSGYYWILSFLPRFIIENARRLKKLWIK